MRVGEPITVKGTRYRVLSAKTASTVGDEFSRERADGKFVVVKLELTNRKNETRTINGDAITLKTSAGKSYSPDTNAQLAVDKPIILEDIQPDVSKTGTLVYDIPSGAASGAKLRVEDLFSDAHGLVRLGL